jgi:adenylate cyclase
VDRFERAIRLSPVDPFRYAFTSGLGIAFMFMEDYERAIGWGRETLVMNPNYLTGLRLLAASLAQSGKIREAEETVRKILAINPSVRIGRLTPAIVRSPNARIYIDGLLKAGLPP